MGYFTYLYIGIYGGYNPFASHLPTSWDIQVIRLRCWDGFLNKSQECALHSFFLELSWADIIDLHHGFQSRVGKLSKDLGKMFIA